MQPTKAKPKYILFVAFTAALVLFAAMPLIPAKNLHELALDDHYTGTAPDYPTVWIDGGTAEVSTAITSSELVRGPYARINNYLYINTNKGLFVFHIGENTLRFCRYRSDLFRSRTWQIPNNEIFSLRD